MIKSSVRAAHGLWRSPKHQTILVAIGVLLVLGWAYFSVASVPGTDGAAGDNSEERLAVLAAGAAATIAIWGVVNQWAISRRQLTIGVLRELETDREYGEALQRFNAIARREATMKIYAKGLPDRLKNPPTLKGRGGKAKRAYRCELKAFEEELKSWRDDEAAINLVLNQDELLAIGIRNSILDYRLICAYWRTALIRRHSSAREFIVELRHQTRTPTMYVEMQRFAEQLERDYYHGLL
ncbi:DUF4760 domain-containing protein [Brevundimonas naejangsanensis]|uniref:DUF4760 domain-containing protein n=1 Tax=Brevundimonas naejangsanensis TaxID=588932 RepID=UPI0039F70D8C